MEVIERPDQAIALGRQAAPAVVLAKLIETHTAAVGVIGMGYVGLPLAKAIVDRQFSVLGFDTEKRKVKLLNAGQSYIRHISSESIGVLRNTGRFSATGEFSRLGDVDVILICVPTPLSRHREPDLSFVKATAESIRRRLRPGQLVVLESTTYPGTTTEVVRPILEASGLTSGVDFFLAYSPEREDPGNMNFSTAGIPKIVGGDGPEATRLATAFYSSWTSKVVPVSTPETAEAAKLTENVFRAVNIALVNELKLIYGAMGIDIWEVIEAAKTKPFGYMPFYPGPGLGGHCIPIDPFYLTWKAREYNIATSFIELAGQINDAMPSFVVDHLTKALDQRAKRGLNGAKILLIGLAYKKNVDDVRESPSLKLIRFIEGRGARAEYYDPFIPEIPKTRDYPDLAGRRSIHWDSKLIASYDAVIIAADHDGIDYKALAQSAQLIVDTRNALARAGTSSDRLIKA